MLQLKHGNMKILYKYVQFWLYYRPNVKLSFFCKNNIFYKSNNLFLIKMYNLKKILITFDDLIIRYHLIKFYSSAVLILFLIEIKNFTYKFIFVHYIWQSFLPKYLLFPLTHNFSLSKSFKYTS